MTAEVGALAELRPHQGGKVLDEAGAENAVQQVGHPVSVQASGRLAVRKEIILFSQKLPQHWEARVLPRHHQHFHGFWLSSSLPGDWDSLYWTFQIIQHFPGFGEFRIQLLFVFFHGLFHFAQDILHVVNILLDINLRFGFLSFLFPWCWR